jgi:hypothetical protein
VKAQNLQKIYLIKDFGSLFAESEVRRFEQENNVSFLVIFPTYLNSQLRG